MSNLSNPVAVFSTLVSLVLPPTFLFFAAHDASGWIRAAATASGLGIGVLVIVAWSMIAVPPLMDREAKEREDALAVTPGQFTIT